TSSRFPYTTLFRSLSLGFGLGADGGPDVGVEQLDSPLGGGPRRPVVVPGEREELVEGQARLQERDAGRGGPHVCRGVAGPVPLGGGDEQALALDDLDERLRYAGRLGELIEREERLGPVGLLVSGKGAGKGAGQCLVGGVELAGEQPSDGRQREALLLEVADPAQPLAVLLRVPRHPPLPR